jgi:GTP-binding protein
VEDGRVVKLFARRGLQKLHMEEGVAGDIIGVAGFANSSVTDTLCAPGVQEPLSVSPIDFLTEAILLSSVLLSCVSVWWRA